MDSFDERSSLLDLEKYGVPEQIFGAVSENLAVSVGFISMLSALLEHKIESLWAGLYGNEASKNGPSMSPTQNIEACRVRLRAFNGCHEEERYARELSYRDKLLPLLSSAEDALDRRNDLVHRVWSEAGSGAFGGYKTPPVKKRGDDKLARSYSEVPADELRDAIAQLADAVRSFDNVMGFVPPGFRELESVEGTQVGLQRTPDPPYVAVIFTSVRTRGDSGYARMSRRMDELAAKQPGYLGHESARSDGLGIAVSYWGSEADAVNWKRVSADGVAQVSGLERWYSDYTVRVAMVNREYGLQDGR